MLRLALSVCAFASLAHCQTIGSEGVAPGKPATFTYDRATSTFQWTAPSALDQNGVITGYVLKAVSIVPGFTQQIFAATGGSYQLTGLLAFTAYNFSLQAINAEGEGLEFFLNILTKEEIPATPSEINQGTPTNDSITISWPEQTPPVGETTYLVSYTDGITTFGPNETASNSYELLGLKPYTEYNITIVAKTNVGTADPISDTFRTAEGIPSAPQNIALIFSPYQIAVTWSAPSEPNGIISNYTIKSTAGGTTQSFGVDSTETSYTIGSVTLSETIYTVEVAAKTGAGEGAAAILTLTTPKLLPTAPRNVAVPTTTITSTSVVVTADAPSNVGDIPVTKYVIMISQDAADCARYNDVGCLSNDQSNTPTGFPTTISGLKPYREYILSVAAEGAAGVGESTPNVSFNTTVGAPNLPAIESVTLIPGGVTVKFNAGTPFTGPAEYNITVTGNDGTTITAQVSSTSEMVGITASVLELIGSTTYSVSIVAQNAQGSSAASSPMSITTTPAPPAVTVNRTSANSLTVVITADSTAISYTIKYVKGDCANNCTVTNVPASYQTSYFITGLMPYTVYNITVFASSASGNGLSTCLTMRTRAGQPTLLNETYVPQLTDGTNVATFRSSYNVMLEDMCATKGEIFNEAEGPIMKVAYFVRQKGATGNVSFTTFYGAVHDQEPSPTFLAITVACSSSARRKRQATNNGVQIGADNTCADGGTEACNGPLKPATAYTFLACGLNEEGNSACTEPSAEVTTGPAPESGGLSAGEIAAIVICSVLLLILIILLIVYIVKRRKHRTGKRDISHRGQANPVFEGKGTQQQKYQVDPTADPPTDYSGATA